MTLAFLFLIYDKYQKVPFYLYFELYYFFLLQILYFCIIFKVDKNIYQWNTEYRNEMTLNY